MRSSRWSGHPDMIKQHALCIADMLNEEYDIPDVEIYMDIWQSMNKRFQQRFALLLAIYDYHIYLPACMLTWL